MATIYSPDSPLSRCRNPECGVQRQFHTASSVPGSRERDHAFEAETVADYEPGELTPAQLVGEIFARPNTDRAVACGAELRVRVAKDLGVYADHLVEALS